MTVTFCAPQQPSWDETVLERLWLGTARYLHLGRARLTGEQPGKYLTDAEQHAGLTLQYNSGRVEGTVNKIKMLKRQMFGRASFDLLRVRVLQPY